MHNIFFTESEAVNRIGGMHLEGNIVPHLWYSNITFDSGKPDLAAIVILAEIVYWHRPIQVKDESSGMIIGAKKKFKSDLLQRSYDSFSQQFGLSKRQSRDALKRLEDMKILKRVFRTVNTSSGPLSNVLFIDLNAEAVYHISNFTTPYYIEMSEGSHLNVQVGTSNRKTYTEITTDSVVVVDEEENQKPKKKELNAFGFFEQNLGVINSSIAEDIFRWIDDFDGNEEIIKHAIRLTAESQKSYSYTKGILKRWYDRGLRTLDEVKAASLEFQRDKEKRSAPAGRKKNQQIDWDSLKEDAKGWEDE